MPPIPRTAGPHPHPGLFLALEGPDGGGKTTQAARLAAWLRGDGFDVVSCRDPGSTAVGDRLREIVLDRDSVHLSIRSEMLIYMASRAQLVDEVIRPSLAAGRVVVSDRFLLSNIVYQGFAGGLPVEDIWRVGQVATAGLLPDLTLVLDVSAEAARARVGPARDRIEDRPAEYQRQVRAGFRRRGTAHTTARVGFARTIRRLVVLIDATGDPDAVFRPDQERGGACPGTRSADMTGSSRCCGRTCGTGGFRTPSCSSVPRASASGPSPERSPRPCSASETRRRCSIPARPARAASRPRPGLTPTCSKSLGRRTGKSCRSGSSATSVPSSA